MHRVGLPLDMQHLGSYTSPRLQNNWVCGVNGRGDNIITLADGFMRKWKLAQLTVLREMYYLKRWTLIWPRTIGLKKKAVCTRSTGSEQDAVV